MVLFLEREKKNPSQVNFDSDGTHHDCTMKENQKEDSLFHDCPKKDDSLSSEYCHSSGNADKHHCAKDDGVGSEKKGNKDDERDGTVVDSDLKTSLLRSEMCGKVNAVVDKSLSTSSSISEKTIKLKEEEELDKMLPNGDVTYFIEKKKGLPLIRRFYQ